MNYQPGPVPYDDANLREYVSRELRKIAINLQDNAATVFYRTSVETESSLSAGDSADYKVGLNSNIIRISTSVTLTLTGISDITGNRERVIVNVGTGVLVLKSEATESSVPHRFALATNWNLSANAAAVLWYDVISARHRGISRT